MGDHLPTDGYRDFSGRLGIDLQSDGGVNAIKQIGGESFPGKNIQQALPPAFGANHAEIGGQCAAQNLPQTFAVPAVTSGDDTDVIRSADLKVGNCAAKGIADHLSCLREAFGICKGNAVIHNSHGKIQHGRHGA